MSSSETTPLLGAASPRPNEATTNADAASFRVHLYAFLNCQTKAGLLYEKCMIFLILVNVAAFVLGTCLVQEYNPDAKDWHFCGPICDELWFGNYHTTSLLEVVTVAVFTMDYLGNVWTADLEDPTKYQGLVGRCRYIVSFFSLVDLASIVPFYVEVFLTPNRDLASSSWVRIFRLLRMMSVEGRYDTALTLVDDVYRRQKGILGTALFVGITTWMTVSSLYYLVERRNLDMIYCPTCDDVDTSLCTIDEWGHANCTAAGCVSDDNSVLYPCWNLYESIPMASYYALLNLFGEFPLVTQHSVGGQIVATLTAVVAVAVFALPAGIIGNGFESVIDEANEKKRQIKEQQERAAAAAAAAVGVVKVKDDVANDSEKTPLLLKASDDSSPTTLSFSDRMYYFWHKQSTPLAQWVDHTIQLAAAGTIVTFVMETMSTNPTTGISTLPPLAALAVDVYNLLAVLLFATDYGMKLYSCTSAANPLHTTRWQFATQFMPLVDLFAFVPFFLEAILLRTLFPVSAAAAANLSTGGTITTRKSTSITDHWVAALRLFRILRWEKYTHAFGTFDKVLRSHWDVLTVTAATAGLLWVLLGSFLYYTERSNPDPEMASNYNTIPNSMWITLLNLSGESPLCQYTVLGKIATGFLGVFATAVFGIPIGVLGASFEKVVESMEDNTKELEAVVEAAGAASAASPLLGSNVERTAYEFVNGMGSTAAKCFEVLIYLLIFMVVGVGIWQTVPGHAEDWHQVEWVAVIIFTVEYLIRFVGAGADPEFALGNNAITARLRYVASFYSIIDLLAIVPFYLAFFLPNSFVDEYDEYLRMVRIVRLVKLDKYIPSITLLDDVIRLKFNSLAVALFAATTLWLLFASFLYLCEYLDVDDGIDPVPKYGCDMDCSMMDRFQNYFDSLYYTGIHLTGDYPITTYTWPGRFVNLLMVFAAVGIVSIPSGLIASGFVEIVQSRNKAIRGELPVEGRAGDDWYEQQYRQLEGVPPPPSRFGPRVDAWQFAVNEFLNGKPNGFGHTEWTRLSYAVRVFMFTIIITNVLAVVLESVPRIDKAVGNQAGNFFDAFEMFSVMVFALEYILRLFCAPKNREALYSTWTYATTFFGIVDLLSTAPWFVQQALIATGQMGESDDNAKIFRIFRIFRILQLEDFVTAFSKLDNVFRASKDVLKATGLLAMIIWVGCGALFFIFEENNPNWRSCDSSIPARGNGTASSFVPGCYDFKSTAACNEYYPGMCSQVAFTSMPNAMYYTAIFLGGEWGVVDFTWPGRLVCLFLCVVGIALYAIPIGTLFDSFGAVLGLVEEDEEDDGSSQSSESSSESEKGFE